MPGRMLRVNQITFFIFLQVDVAWQIHHIISCLILDLPRGPGALRFSLKISWIHCCNLSRCRWLVLTLLFLIGITSTGLLADWLTLSATESIFFFSVSVPGGYFHHPSQSHITSPTELQDQLSIFDAFLESTHNLMLRYIFNGVMQSGPPLNEMP